jgi:hypothetical protein
MQEKNDKISNESPTKSFVRLHVERLSCINFINVIIVCDKKRLIRLVKILFFFLNRVDISENNNNNNNISDVLAEDTRMIVKFTEFSEQETLIVHLVDGSSIQRDSFRILKKNSNLVDDPFHLETVLR